jgi:hypothetical protein
MRVRRRIGGEAMRRYASCDGVLVIMAVSPSIGISSVWLACGDEVVLRCVAKDDLPADTSGN